MDQAKIDEIKRKALPILQNADVKKAAIFGSYVRGDSTEESDIDILIDLPRGKTILDLVGIKQDLEELLNRKVDVVTYRSIHPLLKDSILKNEYPIL